MAIKETCAWLCNYGYCSRPPAELAMVSTRSAREKFFLIVDLLRLFLWSVAVVMTKRPSEKLVLSWRSRMTCATSVLRSAATSPLIFASVSHSTNWNPGGRSGMPPDAKLPSSLLFIGQTL